MPDAKLPLKAIAVLVLATGWLAPALAAETGSSFFDDFSTFNPNRWTMSNGWSSGDFQSCVYVEANVRSVDGKLLMLLDNRPYKDSKYSCAEFKSYQLFSYGTYETKLRAAKGNGVVTAFFGYAGPNPQDEIDFELLGRNPNEIQVNYFADGKGSHEYLAALPSDGSETSIAYAFEWLPDSIRWFIDGRLAHEVKRESGKPFPTRPTMIHFSLWSGAPGTEGWLAPFSYPGTPLTAEIDYVAYTAAGEPCQFPESVACKKNSDSR
jgi:endo-1,3-1,4-beta-glycanase ExoK